MPLGEHSIQSYPVSSPVIPGGQQVVRNSPLNFVAVEASARPQPDAQASPNAPANTPEAAIAEIEALLMRALQRLKNMDNPQAIESANLIGGFSSSPLIDAEAIHQSRQHLAASIQALDSAVDSRPAHVRTTID